MASLEIEDIGLTNRSSPPNPPTVELSAPPQLTFLPTKAFISSGSTVYRHDGSAVGEWLVPPSGMNLKPNTFTTDHPLRGEKWCEVVKL